MGSAAHAAQRDAGPGTMPGIFVTYTTNAGVDREVDPSGCVRDPAVRRPTGSRTKRRRDHDRRQRVGRAEAYRAHIGPKIDE